MDHSTTVGLDLVRDPLEDQSLEDLDLREASVVPMDRVASDQAKDPLVDQSLEVLDQREALEDPMDQAALDQAKDPLEDQSLEDLDLKEVLDPAKDPSAMVDLDQEATVDSVAITAAVGLALAMAPEASVPAPGLGALDVRVVPGGAAVTTMTSGLEQTSLKYNNE